MLEMKEQQFKLDFNNNNKFKERKSKDSKNKRKGSFINFKEDVLQNTK